MLKVYDANDPSIVIPLPLADDKRCVKHVYGGLDKLTFEIESNSPLYQYIAEEVKIEDEYNAYIIKLIDEHSDFVTVTCELDMDDWKAGIIDSFRPTNSTLQSVMESLLPNGWSLVGAGMFAKRTTIEESEGEPFKAVTAFDILETVEETYECVFKFDSINKIVEVINPALNQPSGQFFTDELNLSNLGFTGSSQEFATRLYAYGKKDENGNPLTFASINGGKDYVEDHTYSNKIISAGWSDERYTDKESLLADARAKLKKMSFPVRSYSCDAKYIGEETWLYKVVTLIDRRRKTRVNHMIVEYDEYPNHVKDKVKLSSVEERIETKFDKVVSDMSDALAKKTSNLQKILEESIEHATSMITGNKGGSFVWVYDSEDRPIELLNLGDTLDINTARSVWRWNASGLGHSSTGYNGQYTLALLADGSINASAITSGLMTANIIRAGRLQDVNGLNYWDLETGEFRLVPGNVNVGENKTLQNVLDDIEDAIGEAGGEEFVLTQQNVFNALTNNGQTQGIYLQNGKLYLNATYLATGVLADTQNNTTWDLASGTLTSKKLQINSTNFKLDTSGHVTCSGATMTNLDATGKITASGIVESKQVDLTIDKGEATWYADGARYGKVGITGTHGSFGISAYTGMLYLVSSESIFINAPAIEVVSGNTVREGVSRFVTVGSTTLTFTNGICTNINVQ